jgi:hypothetical protein
MKYIQYNARYAPQVEGTSTIIEIDIPRQILAEPDLVKLAEKKGFTIVEQVRVSATPPNVRLLRKIGPFTNYQEYDDLLKSMERSLKNINCEPRHIRLGLLVPDTYDHLSNRSRNGTHSISSHFKIVKGDLPLPEIASIFDQKTLDEFKRNYFNCSLHVYRNKDDEEGIWYVNFNFTADYYSNETFLREKLVAVKNYLEEKYTVLSIQPRLVVVNKNVNVRS